MAVEPELVGRAEEIALIAATAARGRRHTVQIISTGGVESEANMTDNAPTTVVLIHGLWMTALSWEHWVERYEARGFEVIARSWPGMDADVETLRRDTSGRRPGDRGHRRPLREDRRGARRAADHHPLLLIAGGADHVSPASLTESNFKHYKSDAVTELKVFEGRSHYTLGEQGWEEVADYALDWAVKAASEPAVA